MSKRTDAETSAAMQTARRFARALAREIPVAEGARLVHPECRVHFGGRSFEFPPTSWRNYVKFLWECGRLDNAHVIVETLELESEDMVSGTGRWHGSLDGETVEYPASVRWKIRDKQIIGIYTQLSNYVAFFPAMTWPGGVVVLALRFKWWKRRERPDPQPLGAVS